MLNFFTKGLIKRQLKGMPEAEIEKLFEMIEKNPDFFQKMAGQIQEKMKQGMTQEQAAKSIMESEGDEIKKVLGK
ncbi:MAG: hypothetical protein M3Q80_01705 [bacterium]|nr:hypothetical protein [bacterium]